jgi:hypothetical protein
LSARRPNSGQLGTAAPTFGFTLIELLSALAITTLLVVVIVQMTNSVLHLWPYGRDRVQKNMDARMALELLAQDIRAGVLRGGAMTATNPPRALRWLETKPETGIGPNGGFTATNASWLMFFAVPQDRAGAPRGDVCAVSYRLGFTDPIEKGGTRKTFGLYRTIVDPQTTFTDVLGKERLHDQFWNSRDSLLPEDYLVANVIDFAVVLIATDSTGKRYEIPASSPASLDSALTVTNPPSGLPTSLRLVALDISLTIVSDQAARRLERAVGDGQALVKEASTTFTKRVTLTQ